MACRNNYIITVLVLLLLYYIVTKPVIFDPKETMANYTYGGVPIIYGDDYRKPRLDGKTLIV